MTPEAEDEQDPGLAQALRLSREESGGDDAKDPAAMSVDELLEAREKAIEEEKQRFFDVRRHDSAPPPGAHLSRLSCAGGASRRGHLRRSGPDHDGGPGSRQGAELQEGAALQAPRTHHRRACANRSSCRSGDLTRAVAGSSSRRWSPARCVSRRSRTGRSLTWCERLPARLLRCL